jgi:L-amino acid N-acyltransferase YncA
MCWIYNGRAPVAAARGGWLELPPGVACLEDSVTAASHRGRGIAPRAWDQIAVALRKRGVATMITKVEVDNAPSRRAVEKAGFVGVAVQRMARTGPRVRVDVTVQDEARGGPLRDRLLR